MSIEECKETYYNPNSPKYWEIPADYYMNLAVKNGEIKKTFNTDDYYKEAEVLFQELLQRDDLLELINAPLNYQ